MKTKEKSKTFPRLKVAGIVVVVLALFVYIIVLPAMDSAFEALHHRDCQNHVKQIALAMYTYNDTYHSFPPAYTVDADGIPLHSWRTLLLPFLECEGLYDQIKLDEPWDSDHNKQFHDQKPPVFSCWHSLKHFKRDKSLAKKWEKSITAYQAVVGPGTLFPGSESRSLDDVTRDKSDTIMLLESTVGVCWMAPLDLPIEALEHGVVSAKSGILGVGSYHNGGINVAMIDGRTEFIQNSQSSQDVQKLKKQLQIKGH